MMQHAQELLPSFGTFSNHQGPLPSFTQFGINGYLLAQGEPQAANVGGLCPQGVPQTRLFESGLDNYGQFETPPTTYENLSNMNVNQMRLHDNVKDYHMPSSSRMDRDNCHYERNNNNNIIYYQGKEEINPNIGDLPPPKRPYQNNKKNYKKKGAIREQKVTSSEPDFISVEGKHVCKQCQKTFNKSCYLTQHNKSFHCGERPHKCNQCGKRYLAMRDFNAHIAKHVGEKPHKCEICPKDFNHKTDLRRHMCLHTGEKPYKCDICGKGFIRKDHMMKHHETHNKKRGGSKNLHMVR